MDVALDANAILNEPRMQGNAFRSLLDYLKKTNSSLVLSKVVFDEVIARYPDRVRAAAHKARGPVGALNGLLLTKKIRFPDIDEKAEARKLAQRLSRPSQHVRSIILDNFADVAAEEVAKRGIERIPPANAAGEELRDVIHWLMLTAHVRTSKRETAFITADEHFRQEGDLHPRLKQDLQEAGIHLHFHVSIDDFIKAHAPSPRNLTETDAFNYYGKAHVMDRFEIEARRFFPPRWPSASKIEVVEREVRLARGALYDVGPNSQYGELEFRGGIKARVTTEAPYVTAGYFSNQPIFNQPLLNYDLQDWPLANKVEIASPVVPILHAGHNDALAQNLHFPQSPGWFGNTAPALDFKTAPTTPATFTEDVSEFRVEGNMVISLRVVSGRVTKIETERFELGKIEKVAQPRS